MDPRQFLLGVLEVNDQWYQDSHHELASPVRRLHGSRWRTSQLECFHPSLTHEYSIFPPLRSKTEATFSKSSTWLNLARLLDFCESQSKLNIIVPNKGSSEWFAAFARRKLETPMAAYSLPSTAKPHRLRALLFCI